MMPDLPAPSDVPHVGTSGPTITAATREGKLVVVPMTLPEANAYVERYHRHSIPTVGHKFSVGLAVGSNVVGVAIVGRPVARGLDDGWTLEVLRVCTDGTPHAPSKLYATCWRAARALGYRKLVTYTLQTEPGTSLRAAGWKIVGEVTKRSWDTPSRPRVDKDERQARFRWELSSESDSTLGSKPTTELRQNGQIDMEPDSLQPPDAKRGERPFVLEPTELPLDGTTGTVELPRTVGVAGD